MLLNAVTAPAMLKQRPSFLRLRERIYYFRYQLPMRLWATIGFRELVWSLQTSDKRTATAICRWAGGKAALLFMDTEKTPEELVAEINRLKLDLQDAAAKAEFQRLIDKARVRLADERANDAIFDASVEQHRAKSALNREFESLRNGGRPIASEPKGPPLSDVITRYVENKVAAREWQEKATEMNASIFELLVEICGDVPIDAFTATMAEDFWKTVSKLPPNRSRRANLKGKTVEQLIRENHKPMSLASVSKYVCRVAELFNWAVAKSDIPIERSPFLKVGPSKKAVKKSATERIPFDVEELALLFSGKEFIKRRFENSYSYWMMPLALCTGARQGELAQLHLADFIVEKGVPCINIDDTEPDKKLKSEAAKRLVPIHDFLIELGILRHVDRLREQGHTRLFPELTKRRDGYGQAVSNWFARYRNRNGIKAVQTKVFHSFRHTFICELLDAETPESAVAQIVGHEGGLITSQIYWNKRDATRRKPTVDRYIIPGELRKLIPPVEDVTFKPRAS